MSNAQKSLNKYCTSLKLKYKKSKLYVSDLLPNEKDKLAILVRECKREQISKIVNELMKNK